MLALLLTLGGCFERTHPTAEDARQPVQAVRITLESHADRRSYAGVVCPRREASIGFRTGGRIVERLVDVGALVVAGQDLARLDPVDLALGVRSAEAELSTAQAQNQQAQSDATRSQTLLAEGWISVAADEVKRATALAAAQKVASSATTLALARNQLNYAVLRAPTAGVITAALADPGTVVAEGAPVLRMAEAGPLEVEVALPEATVAGADIAASRATVSVWARPDANYAATLRELSPSADPRLRTYTARYTLTEAPAWLALGMTATVSLESREAGSSLAALPIAALADRGDGPIVWVVDAGTGRIESRAVVVHALRQDRAFVDGLNQGELVVALGVQKLDPQARVRVTDIRALDD
jgi:RND family efflux transporter MFP subunit